MGWDHAFERVRARIHDRMMSYRAVFLIRPAPDEMPATGWAFWRKPRGGRVTPPGEVVLRDLARYCYASRPTLKVSQADQHTDPYAMAFAEGRRDVFNRITAMLNLTSTDIERIAHARTSDD